MKVGDIGTVIDLSITEPDDSNIQQPTEFNTSNDTVDFKFKFCDGSRLTRRGTFITGSLARYTTMAGDLSVEGVLDIQLAINSTTYSWSGSSDIYSTTVGERI